MRGVDAPETLNNWIDYLEKQAQVILLRAHDQARAFKMFETLNDRGLRTSQADLVKSYLFGLMEGDIDTAQSRWSIMLENLQELEEDDPQVLFLRHYLIAYSGFVRADGVYEAIQRKFQTAGSAASFMGAIASASKVYVATFNADSEHWNEYSQETRKQLADFGLFDLKPMRPLLLALATEFDKKHFGKAIKLLTSLSVRLVLTARTRSGVNEQTFAEAARVVAEGDITTAKELAQVLAKVWVSDRDFKEVVSTAKVSKAQLARYYLREMEHYVSNGDRDEAEWVNSDPAHITLEHILPRNPSGAGWAGFDEETSKEYKNRLGNLCLLKRSENNGMGNENYQQKLVVFQKSSLKLTKGLPKIAGWTPSAIDERQIELAEIAVATWSND